MQDVRTSPAGTTSLHTQACSALPVSVVPEPSLSLPLHPASQRWDIYVEATLQNPEENEQCITGTCIYMYIHMYMYIYIVHVHTVCMHMYMYMYIHVDFLSRSTGALSM